MLNKNNIQCKLRPLLDLKNLWKFYVFHDFENMAFCEIMKVAGTAETDKMWMSITRYPRGNKYSSD